MLDLTSTRVVDNLCFAVYALYLHNVRISSVIMGTCIPTGLNIVEAVENYV